jgi:hypothetical protein
MPQPAEHKEFVDQLKSAFKDARPGRVSFVASNERINEITLVTLVNLFPLRFARTLKALKERYEARLSQPGGRAPRLRFISKVMAACCPISSLPTMPRWRAGPARCCWPMLWH